MLRVQKLFPSASRSILYRTTHTSSSLNGLKTPAASAAHELFNLPANATQKQIQDRWLELSKPFKHRNKLLEDPHFEELQTAYQALTSTGAAAQLKYKPAPAPVKPRARVPPGEVLTALAGPSASLATRQSLAEWLEDVDNPSQRSFGRKVTNELAMLKALMTRSTYITVLLKDTDKEAVSMNVAKKMAARSLLSLMAGTVLVVGSAVALYKTFLSGDKKDVPAKHSTTIIVPGAQVEEGDYTGMTSVEIVAVKRAARQAAAGEVQTKAA